MTLKAIQLLQISIKTLWFWSLLLATIQGDLWKKTPAHWEAFKNKAIGEQSAKISPFQLEKAPDINDNKVGSIFSCFKRNKLFSVDSPITPMQIPCTLAKSGDMPEHLLIYWSSKWNGKNLFCWYVCICLTHFPCQIGMVSGKIIQAAS